MSEINDLIDDDIEIETGDLNRNNGNFVQYSKDHHLETVADYSAYAQEHHLKMRNLGVVVTLEILNTGSHFSQENYNLAILYLLLLLVFTVLAIINL